MHHIVSFSADEAFDGSYPTNVVLTSEGGCTYIPPGIFKSTCKIDITWFPFDDQDCEMKFGSWTYDGGKVSMFSRIARKKNTIQQSARPKRYPQMNSAAFYNRAASLPLEGNF
jgi:hypothetical protein